MNLLQRFNAALRREPDWQMLGQIEQKEEPDHAPEEQRGLSSINQDHIPQGTVIRTLASGGVQRTNWDTSRAIRDGLEVLPIIYVCVHAIASAVSTPEYRVYERTSKGVLQPAFDSDFQRLLTKPNKFQPQGNFIYRTMQHLLLGGNGLMHKTRRVTGRKKGQPLELWLKGPNGIKPIAHPQKFISVYEHRCSTDGISQIKTYSPKDIIHLQMPHPSDERWGMAPMMAAAVPTDAEISASKWQQSKLDNHAAPSGILNILPEVVEEEFLDNDADVFETGLELMPGMTEDQKKAWRDIVREEMQGANNAGKVAILEGAIAKFIPMSMTPAEMDFMASRKFNREDILAVFGVPPPVAGYYERATLKNIDTAFSIFWQQTVLAYIEDLCQILTLGLRPDFGEQYVVVPNLSNISQLLPLLERKLKCAKLMRELGYEVDDINNHLGLGMPTIGSKPNKMALTGHNS
jgi:phage portal protein BeeE